MALFVTLDSSKWYCGHWVDKETEAHIVRLAILGGFLVAVLVVEPGPLIDSSCTLHRATIHSANTQLRARLCWLRSRLREAAEGQAAS